MFFDRSNGYSVNNMQDFMWAAEYINGKYLLEFDEKTNKENSFYFINKEKLIRFGIVGCGHKMFFNTYDGTFNISGRTIDIQYIDEHDKIYNLTKSNNIFNNIVQFKCAESNFDLLSNTNNTNCSIEQFNFGYKQKIKINDTEFNLKVICKVPYNSPTYLEITLTCNKNLNGKLLIKRNDKIIDCVNAPLKQNIKGILNWDVI